MAAIIDLSQFNFTGEEITAIGELVMEDVLRAPEFEAVHSVFEGIVEDKTIGFYGEGGLVGVKNQGCDPEPQAWTIATRALKWTPEEWEVLIHACWQDLKNTAAAYSLKTATPIADFTRTDYMNIVIEVLSIAMQKFMWRLFWFNDTAAANVTGGGKITDGIDPKYFNIIDGYWKQIVAQITANPAQRVTITENAGANYGAQKLNTTNIQNYLKDLYFGAPLQLRGDAAKMILATQSFVDAYVQSLMGMNLPVTYTNMVDGLQVPTYQGIALRPIPIWDEIIAEYFDNGTKLDNPHRALFISKNIVGVGVNRIGDFENIDIWYDKDSRKVKMEAMGTADAKLLNPEMFKVAI